MLEVLPTRFEMNMAAFGNYVPTIYEQFKSYNPEGVQFFAVKMAFLTCAGMIRVCHFMVTILIKNRIKIRIGRVLNSPGSIQTIEFSKKIINRFYSCGLHE